MLEVSSENIEQQATVKDYYFNIYYIFVFSKQ